MAKTFRYYEAFVDATEALRLGFDYDMLYRITYKALYRKGKALENLGCYSDARACYKLVLWVRPSEWDVYKDWYAIEKKVTYFLIALLLNYRKTRCELIPGS